MTVSSPISDRRFQEFFLHRILSRPLISSWLFTNCAGDIKHLFQREIFKNSWRNFVAAFIVAAMNIPHIIECSSLDSATFDILFCLLRTWSLTLSTNSAASLPMDEIFWISLFLVMHWHGFPRSIVNLLSVPCRMRIFFCREEVFHDEGHTCCNRIPRNILRFPRSIVFSISTFPTLEKTKIDHNPLVYNLVVTVAQVSPFYRHLQQIFQDLDIHTRSSPGFDKVEEDTTVGHPRGQIHHGSRFGCDTFFSWFLLSSFCHCSSAKL